MWSSAVLLGVVAACSDGTGPSDDAADPCADLACSEHARCAVQDGQPVCSCDPGFHAEGLACVSDVAPDVTVVLEVDVSGNEVPLDQYGTIVDPPPPGGNGRVSIAGNQTQLADWTPNTVFCLDDGAAPDLVAADLLWTCSFAFPPGTSLEYKYTVAADEGQSWGGTEEFPLTTRGFTVPADGSVRIRVRDVFADRPAPSGTAGALTHVTVEE